MLHAKCNQIAIHGLAYESCEPFSNLSGWLSRRLVAAELMGEKGNDFWQLERTNRRKTVELVAIFILIYAVLGLLFDHIFHTFRILDYHPVGFPVLTSAAAIIATAQALRAYYRGSDVLSARSARMSW